MHTVIYLLDTRARSNLTLNKLLSTKWFSESTEGLSPSDFSAPKDLLKSEGIPTQQPKNVGLITTVLFTVI